MKVYNSGSQIIIDLKRGRKQAWRRSHPDAKETVFFLKAGDRRAKTTAHLLPDPTLLDEVMRHLQSVSAMTLVAFAQLGKVVPYHGAVQLPLVLDDSSWVYHGIRIETTDGLAGTIAIPAWTGGGLDALAHAMAAAMGGSDLRRWTKTNYAPIPITTACPAQRAIQHLRDMSEDDPKNAKIPQQIERWQSIAAALDTMGYNNN